MRTEYQKCPKCGRFSAVRNGKWVYHRQERGLLKSQQRWCENSGKRYVEEKL